MSWSFWAVLHFPHIWTCFEVTIIGASPVAIHIQLFIISHPVGKLMPRGSHPIWKLFALYYYSGGDVISMEEETKIQIHPCCQKGLLFLRNLLSKCLLNGYVCCWSRCCHCRHCQWYFLKAQHHQHHQIPRKCNIHWMKMFDDNVGLHNETTVCKVPIYSKTKICLKLSWHSLEEGPMSEFLDETFCSLFLAFIINI